MIAGEGSMEFLLEPNPTLSYAFVIYNELDMVEIVIMAPMNSKITSLFSPTVSIYLPFFQKGGGVVLKVFSLSILLTGSLRGMPPVFPLKEHLLSVCPSIKSQSVEFSLEDHIPPFSVGQPTCRLIRR